MSAMLDKGRLYWWVPAYDSAYSQYSPGRLLLHFLLRESFNQHHTEFDFLWGDEDYKWYYATHVRLIADLGARPFPKQLKNLLRTVLRPFPGVKNSLKRFFIRLTTINSQPVRPKLETGVSAPKTSHDYLVG